MVFLLYCSKELAVNRLKELLGEHQSGKAGVSLVSWKDISTERVDVKRLKQDCPDIHSQYLSASSYRRFSIK
jgi:predicted phage-related endonuclease